MGVSAPVINFFKTLLVHIKGRSGLVSDLFFKPSHSKDITQTQQQGPELPTVTLTWHASTYKVYKHPQMHVPLVQFTYTLYLFACQVRVTVGGLGLCCCVCVTSFKC